MSVDIVPGITSHYSRSNEHSVVNNDIDIVTGSLASTVLNYPAFVDGFGKNEPSMQHQNLDLMHIARELNSEEQIFKVLWSEPSGSSAEEETFSSRRKEHGEMVSATFRRRIITYKRRATDKPGVHAEEHIFIYTMVPKFQMRTFAK
ncbi:uncharacterized protein Bfra_003805 [Botrytis fragariae]|uniref:Uncharacterized protein n=1 Tax=Botrytis fragariae TaxID=1964551 RepID=A0A8H6AX44_9HELO|nr:uncharacterized protein Bfra_003805 [Botrytis fragariae]KAF5875351.1 hypothetical protein Bfra_003805 [Botrytis fragariae]